ncbi:hypothetical protein [Paracoccus zhejiangensis]|uniref:Lipoprotein n=1 Tax=Paracoccus zhejiangensis TaxID=1077935 RepID=A0A2H5EV70_9RHOB|nr:hypothetical protein [Paracoccus zhejiangensis]AUH63198.1 hypothetical protein CX676_02690 [Paracoccus zhejiangensis]
MKTVSLFAIATIATLGLAACEEGAAPPVPEPAAGPIDAPGSLNGTYNLRASDCTDQGAPETRLTIEGNKFNFYESACTVAASEPGTSSTQVTLSCAGEGEQRNRVVELQNRPGELRLTDDSTTLTYFKCEAGA